MDIHGYGRLAGPLVTARESNLPRPGQLCTARRAFAHARAVAGRLLASRTRRILLGRGRLGQRALGVSFCVAEWVAARRFQRQSRGGTTSALTTNRHCHDSLRRRMRCLAKSSVEVTGLFGLRWSVAGQPLHRHVRRPHGPSGELRPTSNDSLLLHRAVDPPLECGDGPRRLVRDGGLHSQEVKIPCQSDGPA